MARGRQRSTVTLERAPDPKALAARMRAIEAAAREAAAEVWALHDHVAAEEKRPDDWVSEADRVADRLIRAVRDRRCPDDGWLSEESLSASAAGAFTWVVDPIDGTREFLTGCPEHAVSIGLLWEGTAVGGAVAHPPSGVLMAGSVDEGCRPADTRNLPGARGGETGLRILVSRTDVGRERFSGWPEELPLAAVGSIAYKLALVAYGEGDAVVSLTGKSAWDVAGGFGVLRAVGLSPRFLDGQDHPLPSTNERVPPFIVARDPSLAQTLLDAAQHQRRRWTESKARRP